MGPSILASVTYDYFTKWVHLGFSDLFKQFAHGLYWAWRHIMCHGLLSLHVESCPDLPSECLHPDGLWWSQQHVCLVHCPWWSTQKQSHQRSDCAAWCEWEQILCICENEVSVYIHVTSTRWAETWIRFDTSVSIVLHVSLMCEFSNMQYTCNMFHMALLMDCAACYLRQINVRSFMKTCFGWSIPMGQMHWITHCKTNKGMHVWAVQWVW